MAPAGCWRDRFAGVLDEADAGTMRQGKTQYLSKLESLRATYTCCGNGSILCNKYCKIALSFELTKTCGRAESMIEMLRKHFVFGIDQDVDYEAWSKPETWASSATEASGPRAWSCGMTTSPEECRAVVQRILEVLSCLESEMGAMAGIEELRFMFSMFAKAIEHGDNRALDNVLRRILTKFCASLREIDRVINEKHDSAYYKRIFQDQRLHYQETIGQEVVGDYSAWKDQHLDDDIEEEALQEYVDEAMKDLFRAKVFDGIKDGAGRKKKEAYRREVCFDECDCPNPARFYKAYACFREVFDYRDGEYIIDEVKAGKLIFKIRKDPDKVKAFFWFVQTMALVSDDIDALHDRQRVESICDGVDFRDLRSRFSEAQVKASGIKNHADIVLALIDRMQREKIPNTYWLAFFCVLSQKKWIEGNVRAFASNMNSLFNVKLDHRALSRSMKDWGNDINLWPEEDGRQRKKKAFGQEFQKCLEACIKGKIMSIWSDAK